MDTYNITGMSCAACSARVEKAVSKVSGVTSCSVSLLTNSMGVEGNASSKAIIKAVVDAGYGASLVSGNSSTESGSSISQQEKNLENSETPVLKKRLIFSVGFLLVLMYFSMGHMMWNWPLPPWFNGNHVAIGLVQLLLALTIMLINKKFFVSGFKSLSHGSPNMDTLVALGSGISFTYSTVMLFLMTDAVLHNPQKVSFYMNNFYFEGAAMIVTLITVGKLLESISKGKTTNALKSLLKLSPKTATILQNGKEVLVDIEKVHIDDVFVVRPGESIPVDGIILEGETSINESVLTGESIPCDKLPGDLVSAATINQQGFIKCRAARVGQDTTLSQIIKMVSEAAATKAPIAKIADKVSGVFVPSVICISVITFIVWLICGAEFGFALSRGIAVLVISCPCALGLATPVAIMVGNGMGAKNGILFKTSAALEATGQIQIVALDKTGTITEGKPVVTNLYCGEGFSEKSLLQLALNLEAKSEHPLAKAITEKALSEKLTAENVENFEALSGNGVHGLCDKMDAFGGSVKFISSKLQLSKEILELCDKISEEGKTPLLFVKGNAFAGMIAVADVIKPESAKAVKELKALGIKTVMLTGDNQKTANAIGKQALVDKVIAGVQPQEKAAVIKELKALGKVCMVGDGINDAPALTTADIGVAIGAGTDVAIDAADVVLMKNQLTDVSGAIRLSRGTLKNIRENLFWAFFYNIIGIPLAAGAYYHAFGWSLNPMFCAAAMSLSSFCVVTNALRLNLINIRNTKHDRKIKQIVEDEEMFGSTTEKVIKVDGMMCEHCEAHVKEALEKIKGVKSAKADHNKGEVILTLSKNVADSEFEKAVTEAGYKFLG